MDDVKQVERELADWKQAASVEAGLRREFAERVVELEKVLTSLNNRGGLGLEIHAQINKVLRNNK